MVHAIENIIKTLDKYGVPKHVLALVGLLILFLVVFPLVPGFFYAGLAGFVALMPFWLPIFLGYTFFRLWMAYVQMNRFVQTEHTLLEIRLSEEITQSPLAMETLLNVFFQTGGIDTPIDEYVKGATFPFFSLEIASLEGRVHFYIWMEKKYRRVIEAQIYSQYPTVEVEEVGDYAAGFHFDPYTMSAWGIEQELKKPDPYPIKTYIEFGLDKETKEEFKTDPLSSVIEFLGSIGKGEYIFMQIVFRAHHKKTFHKEGTWFEKMDWHDMAEQEIEKILSKTVEDNGKANFSRLTKPEQEMIEVIDKNLNKKPFEVGMRIMYFSKNEYHNKERYSGIPTMFRSFESHSYNGLKPKFVVGPFNYPWQNLFGRARRLKQKKLFDSYQWRSFFYPPYKKHFFVLSAEELATLYHFPGKVVTTPSLERIGSLRAEAPSNLPTAHD